MGLFSFLKSSKTAPEEVSERSSWLWEDMPSEGILERLPEGVQERLDDPSVSTTWPYSNGQRGLLQDNQVSGQFCVSVHNLYGNGARRAVPVDKRLDEVSARFMEQHDRLGGLVAEASGEPLPLKVRFKCEAMPRGAENYNDIDYDDTQTPNFPPELPRQNPKRDESYSTDGSFPSANGVETVFPAPVVKGGPIVTDMTFDNAETGYKIALLTRLKSLDK